MAVMVGSPADNRYARKPDSAIVLRLTPAAVVVEVFIADDVRGDVASGHRVLDAAVALGTPVVKIIAGVVPRLNVSVDLVGASESADFARMDGVSGATAGDFSLASTDENYSGIAGFVDVDLVIRRDEEE